MMKSFMQNWNLLIYSQSQAWPFPYYTDEPRWWTQHSVSVMRWSMITIYRVNVSLCWFYLSMVSTRFASLIIKLVASDNNLPSLHSEKKSWICACGIAQLKSGNCLPFGLQVDLNVRHVFGNAFCIKKKCKNEIEKSSFTLFFSFLVRQWCLQQRYYPVHVLIF